MQLSNSRTRDSGISLVEQIECIILSKRHAIAKPGIWMLIINFHDFPLFPARRHIKLSFDCSGGQTAEHVLIRKEIKQKCR